MHLPSRPDPKDRALFVEFTDVAVENPAAKLDPEAPKFIDVPFVKITVDAFTVVEQKARETEEYSDRKRFPDAWELYLAKKKGERIGTPMKFLDGMTPAQIKNYEMLDIYSVEQLSTSSDNLLSKVMGGLADRKKAISYLEISQGKAKDDALASKFEAIQMQLDAQAQALAEKDKLIAQLQSKSVTKQVKEKVNEK